MVAEAVRHLVIDLGEEAGEAAERRLDMPAGAAETVIEIEVTECGIEIVSEHELDHAAAEPDAFGIAGGAVDGLSRFNKFVDLALILLGRIGRIGGRLLALVLGVVVATLGERGSGAADAYEDNKPGNCETAHKRFLKLKHASTHGFPKCLKNLPLPSSPTDAAVMPTK